MTGTRTSISVRQPCISLAAAKKAPSGPGHLSVFLFVAGRSRKDPITAAMQRVRDGAGAGVTACSTLDVAGTACNRNEEKKRVDEKTPLMLQEGSHTSTRRLIPLRQTNGNYAKQSVTHGFTAVDITHAHKRMGWRKPCIGEF